MAQDHRPATRNETLFQALIGQGCTIELAVRIVNGEARAAPDPRHPLPPYDDPKPSRALLAWR